jgi:hypothetical protein
VTRIGFGGRQNGNLSRKRGEDDWIWVSNTESIDNWSFGFTMSGINVKLKGAQ